MYTYLFFAFSVIVSVSVFYGISVNASQGPHNSVGLKASESADQETEVLVEVVSDNDSLVSSEDERPDEILSETNTVSKQPTPKTELKVISDILEDKSSDEAGDYTNVPFYSQFADISTPNRKKVGCGVASLAMLIELYNPDHKVSVDQLFEDGLRAGAYLDNAGWIHAGLINLSKGYGLDGQSHGLADMSTNSAFERLKTVLKNGPVIASVHYTFDPQNPIPHLVVVNGIAGDRVYYNDPAEPSGGNHISKDKFIKAWKKRYIEIRPIS